MELEDVVLRAGGVLTRADGLAAVGRHRFDNAVKRGLVVPVFPRVYALPWDVDQTDVRRRAALASVGGEAALSHVTALEARGLPAGQDRRIHVTAYNPRHPRGVPDELVVHRTRLPLEAGLLDGLPTVAVDTAVVTSWSMLSGPDRRAPLLEAYRRRLLSLDRLIRTVESAWWLEGRRDLRSVVALIAAGCESELELWGYTSVFDVPELRGAERQRVVRVDGATYRLDMAFENEKLNVELDGRAYHASPEQWERDIRRDRALATLGWQTIRFSHKQLTSAAAACRSETIAVLEARRRSVA